MKYLTTAGYENKCRREDDKRRKKLILPEMMSVLRYVNHNVQKIN